MSPQLGIFPEAESFKTRGIFPTSGTILNIHFTVSNYLYNSMEVLSSSLMVKLFSAIKAKSETNNSVS